VRHNRQSRSDARSARDIALELLARREHSRHELRQKLVHRGFDADEVSALLDGLSAERLQSDARFVESYVHARQTRGFGPGRIRMELKERGIADLLIEQQVDERADHWRELLRVQYRKRYGDSSICDYAERARRGRFLQQRGFSTEMVARFLSEIHRN
jgi:regulatory protein